VSGFAPDNFSHKTGENLSGFTEAVLDVIDLFEQYDLLSLIKPR
jgi:hypothetical protein